MARSLKDIETTEISFVDKPAIKKKFLFFKQEKLAGKSQAGSKTKQKKITIGIESDGTVGGTKIVVNGDELKDLRDFMFSFFLGEDRRNPVSCSYSKFVETEDGFKRTETFYLSKGDEVMNPELVELLKEYLGDEFDAEKFEKAEKLSDKALNAIKGALKLVNKYKADFPDDLKKVVGVLAKYAGYGYGYPAKKEDVEKAGAKFSKETLEKLKKAIEALEALKAVLPELKEQTEKSGTENSDIKKSIEEITKKIEAIEKGKQDGEKDELTETLKGLTERLEVVEKGTGVKKSIKGQDDDDNLKKVNWPSFQASEPE